jgi:hypothetical protein
MEQKKEQQKGAKKGHKKTHISIVWDFKGFSEFHMA